MKREIKFRAWQNNKMIYSPLNSNYGLQRFFGLLYEDAHIMQFTGLHDKNGKEIYEGDIYIINDGSPYKIMFVNGAFVGGKHEGYCSPIGWEIQECNDELSPSNFNTKIVIIGNIYENPELCNT